LISLLNRT